MLLQAFAEPSQQGTAPASGGQEEASSAAATVPQAQISEQLAGVVEEQAPQHTRMEPQQQQILAHPQHAHGHAAVERQAGLAVSTEQGQVDVRNQGRHSDNGAFNLPGSNFNDEDPSNPDGKLMSLLMG